MIQEVHFFLLFHHLFCIQTRSTCSYKNQIYLKNYKYSNSSNCWSLLYYMYVSGADRRITTHCMYKRLNSIHLYQWCGWTLLTLKNYQNTLPQYILYYTIGIYNANNNKPSRMLSKYCFILYNSTFCLVLALARLSLKL